MKTRSISPTSLSKAPVRPTWLEKLARRLLHSRLRQLQEGQLTVREGDTEIVYGRLDGDCDLQVTIEMLHPAVYSDLAFGGSIGAGEAYMQRHWRCDDLAGLLRLFLINRDVLEDLDSGLSSLTGPFRKTLHWINRNTRRGSRRNIAAHYDIGNDFYALWLDPTMMYSCAFFETSDTPLHDASLAKLERICKKLNLSAADSVMEIGTGWGGFAIYAARKYGCKVTTTTISRQQYEFARARIREAGLEDRITLLLDDYRDLSGQYDKLVSIEMVEAVGHQFHDSYFTKCCELLKPEGQMLLQAITIADQHYLAYKTRVDFIRRYIFPGGCLTSLADMKRVITRHTDMRVLHVEDIGLHYAKTLRHWKARFFDSLDDIRAIGYSDAFIRMWEFYLCYCESAFVERATSNVQMLITRPAAR